MFYGYREITGQAHFESFEKEEEKEEKEKEEKEKEEKMEEIKEIIHNFALEFFRDDQG
ncbi:hypothetical protein MM_0539 [Methanosarcina mazei Go1]|uniref:Uncharacterized protein n=1 Tax=Methanosarcina mazei (strain ATCC BAA-159 / DSM 3647 / Goe1 / Go1 / JCM 11833 / OCM 88) TaxID=192952 RepID=Q8PZF5_METMA|nr:hypothetical protein [Methanosarcina mazei]AAM30235.1 hypothetical protein MM_0539 [Methanosarcina mazei Go1]WIM43804.1 hypothetical protein PSF70_02950 [Methanosarcina mazei]WIM47258.1 hypothetical protein PQQ20_02935 [Methanosarcina mazei]